MREAQVAIAKIRPRLTDEQLLIVARKLAGATDAEIARTLGVHRRTAAYRKSVALAALADEFEPLTDDVRLACLDLLAVGPTREFKPVQNGKGPRSKTGSNAGLKRE